MILMSYLNTVAQNITSFVDTRDNRIYIIVNVGTQTWMAENLAYLPDINTPQSNTNTSARYYVYDYNGRSISEAKSSENYKNYGVLYNHAAAIRACPTGWHLPSDLEWKMLNNHLGRDAGKLKMTSGWKQPNTGATNESMFSAKPGGVRQPDGEFVEKLIRAYWWGSNVDNLTGECTLVILYYGQTNLILAKSESSPGCSVRCIKD